MQQKQIKGSCFIIVAGIKINNKKKKEQGMKELHIK